MDNNSARNSTLLQLVDELCTLNDDNLAQRVIDNSDVQWCLSELYDILKAEKHAKYIHTGFDELYCGFGKCSVCDFEMPFGCSYCPGCGARLDLED